MSVGRSVGPSVGPSVTFLNSERVLHYCSCPTVRDWIAVYPALFEFIQSERIWRHEYRLYDDNSWPLLLGRSTFFRKIHTFEKSLPNVDGQSVTSQN